ncbi:MAG TPA: hypothetical protein VF832_07780, partial [Longimicrobiales bacterium]
MPTYRTPDVYIEEISVFPPSVAEVETAVPAFIGYTQQAKRTTADDLVLKPTKIFSLKEYEQYFGGKRSDALAVTVAGDAANGFSVTSFTVNTQTPGPTFNLPYLLYYAVKMYFDNGGGQCYIVSVGTYQAVPSITLKGTEPDAGGAPETNFGLQDGLDAVALEDEPTLIVIPDAVNLSSADYQALVQAVLLQAGTLKDRFGIFDVYDGDTDLDSAAQNTNRGYFGNNNLKYGAAYYPFLRTSMTYFQDGGEAGVTVTLPDASTPRL